MKIKFKNGSIVKKNLPARLKKSQVIRIQSAMEKDKATELQQQTQQQQAQSHQSSNTGTCSDEFKDEFYNSGRIGRRNAMPDILDEDQRETTTADLPLKLSALTTNDPSSSSSTSHQAPNQTNNK